MITVTDQIEYGNVVGVEIDEFSDYYQLKFAADAHGGLERMWFCFRVENADKTQQKSTIKLVLKHYDSMLGGSSNEEVALRIRPVIRYQGETWKRLDAGEGCLHDDGKMDIQWEIRTPENYADIALCYPYGITEVKQLVSDYPDVWQLDEIGVSQEGNSLLRLANDYGKLDSEKPGIFIFARQHSGEVSGSWVLDGFLREMADNLGDFTIWCVPLANIDGVVNGDYGKNPFPHDMNRAWDRSAPMRHETKVYMRDMNRWQHRCRAEMILDFHSPGIAEYGIYSFNTSTYQEDQEVITKLNAIGAEMKDYASEPFIRYTTYKANSVWGSYKNLSEYAAEDLKILPIIFECSYFADGQARSFEQSDYQNAGRCIARQVKRSRPTNIE